MTQPSPTDSNGSHSLSPAIGLLGGRWVDQDQLVLPVNDIGFRQGATAVERMRTYGGEVFQLDSHLDRWQETVAQLGIEGLPLRAALAILIDELIGRNGDFADAAGEFGITMFATPGCLSADPPVPTFCLHLNPINLDLVAKRREHGQPLVMTGVRQPAAECWPRAIKVRSRLHYYLADEIASGHGADTLGLLTDEDGSVTETSIANIAIVAEGEIVSPGRHQVLGGITQQVVEAAAADLGIRWNTVSLSPKLVETADEVLLMGTDGGLWFANAFDGRAVNDGKPGEVYGRLLKRFDEIAHS